MSTVITLDLQPTYSIVLELEGDGSSITISTDNTALELELVPLLRGPGVPPGGTTGQVAAKASDADFDVVWVDQSGGGNFADLITPAGGIDGANRIFTLPQAPAPAASLQLFRNGLLQQPGGFDYTLASATITYVTAPSVGDTHVTWYRH